MSGLEAFLLIAIDDDFPFTKYYPLDYSNHNSIGELIIIANSLRKCGKGSLQHKNKIFYYRTYIPTLTKNEGNSNSDGNFSDYFIYSYDCNKKKFFILYLCDLNYKVKFIDELTNKIFEVLDNSAFEGHEIKIESSNQINSLFMEYKKMTPNLAKINPLIEINKINNSSSSINDSGSCSGDSKIENINKKQLNKSKKRIDTRMVLPKENKSKSGNTVSVDIDDITSMRDTETDLSIMFKHNFDNDFNEPHIKKWRTIKIFNLVLCLIVFIIFLIIFIFF